MNSITISGQIYTEGRVERLEDPNLRLSKAWMQIFDAEGKPTAIVPLLAWGNAEREGGAYEALAKVKAGDGVFVVGTLSTHTVEKGQYKERAVEVLVSQVTTLSEHQAAIAKSSASTSSTSDHAASTKSVTVPQENTVTDTAVAESEPEPEAVAPVEPAAPVTPRPASRSSTRSARAAKSASSATAPA